jgi:hypothetical protein
MSAERHLPGYVPEFDLDAKVGRQGELIVKDVVRALEAGASETKNDVQALRTGNLFVEFRCKSQRTGLYEASGIAGKTAAEVWCFVVDAEHGVTIVVSRNHLLALSRRAYSEGRIKPGGLKGKNPTQGVLVPISWLLPIAKEAAA